MQYTNDIELRTVWLQSKTIAQKQNNRSISLIYIMKSSDATLCIVSLNVLRNLQMTRYSRESLIKPPHGKRLKRNKIKLSVEKRRKKKKRKETKDKQLKNARKICNSYWVVMRCWKIKIKTSQHDWDSFFFSPCDTEWRDCVCMRWTTTFASTKPSVHFNAGLFDGLSQQNDIFVSLL